MQATKAEPPTSSPAAQIQPVFQPRLSLGAADTSSPTLATPRSSSEDISQPLPSKASSKGARVVSGQWSLPQAAPTPPFASGEALASAQSGGLARPAANAMQQAASRLPDQHTAGGGFKPPWQGLRPNLTVVTGPQQPLNQHEADKQQAAAVMRIMGSGAGMKGPAAKTQVPKVRLSLFIRRHRAVSL